MKSVFGRINLNNELNNQLFEDGLANLARYKKVQIQKRINSLWGFGEVLYFPFQQTESLQNKDFIIIADCRIDNRKELIAKLCITDKNITDELLILESYKKWGEECPAHLLGDFAFAIWNSSAKELFCARDHFGAKPLFYSFNGEDFIFSSEIKAILSQNDLFFSIDEQYIADTLSIIKSEKNRTTFNEIQKLPPAHSLLFKMKAPDIKPYWELTPQKQLTGNESDILSQFKEILIKSVECRIQPNLKTGAELSGGLDSSSITAVASRFTKLSTFSHILPDHQLGKIHPFKDERDFIKQLTDYCSIEDSFFITSETTGIVNTLKENIEHSGFVSQQNFAAFSDHLYQTAAKNGVSVLLSGFSGDEVITSKSGNYLLELASNNNWEEIKEDLKNQNVKKHSYYRKLGILYFKTRFPGVYTFLSRFKNKNNWWESKYENLALNKQFEEKLNIKKRYYDYYSQETGTSLQARNIERITHPHVAQRLEYSAIAARKYGIEYRYPFLDKRLIEFYLSMPPRLKARNGIVRYAIREAMKEILPEGIRLRNDKSGTTIPTVFMRMLHDADKIDDILTRAGKNPKTKGFIDIELLKNWYESLKRRSQNDRNINPGAFYNYFKMILFIEQNPGLFQ